jgi:DNA-binding CsgD family transcriptional regulator/catechol 2,3-dioxygenase-like lactoylglutathione lyase family enzyme
MHMRKFPRRGRPAHDDVLTPAEWRTLHAIQHGLSARQIAQRSGVSADAVKYHVENIRAKLGVADTRSLRTRLAVAKTSAMKGLDMQLNVEISGVGQIARGVRDVKLSEQWYRDVLGLPHLYTFGSLAFFDCGGMRLMLSQSESIKDESIIYFRTGNLLKAWEEMKRKGLEFMDAPHLIHTHSDGTEEWMVFFKDLEDRPLALMSQVAPK